MNSINSQGRKIGDLTEGQDDIVHRVLPFREGGYVADLIRGSVGSGKTIVLTKRAEWLYKMRPELKILVCAFNIDMSRDLRTRIENEHIKVVTFFDLCKDILGSKFPKLEIYREEQGPRTIKKWIENNKDMFEGESLEPDTVSLEISRHKDMGLGSLQDYLGDVISRRELLTPRQIETIHCMYEFYLLYQDQLDKEGIDSTDFEDTVNKTLNELFGHKLEHSFDVIMIDEAQDWAPKWIQLIKRLLKPGGYIFLCDDPAQSLWKRFDWKQKGIRGYETINLELPERTTKEIMDCAQRLFDIDERLHANYDLDFYPVKTDHLLHGDKPIVKICKTLIDEHQYIALIIQDFINKSDGKQKIGILSPKFDENKEWAELPFMNDKDVYFGHFNLPKGLEFDTVVIPHLDQIFPEQSSADTSYELSNLRKLFVAMTRAKKQLFITTTQSFPSKLRPLLDLCKLEAE